MTAVTEHVVLVDEHGAATGTAAKREVHGRDTPLHLGFSCYVLDADGRVLLTRRALDKATFPGVWTNTVCGHPALGERVHDAVCRRAADELGLTLVDVRLVLPDFRYRAVMEGVVENELCPVLVARAVDPAAVRPALDEVEDAAWLPWAEFARSVLTGERVVSPWCAEQVPLLDALGPDPARWPAGDPAELPAALRPGG
ncbi:MAG TPA: isopentenyl-diphosphate Delta-isomerase [Dermatophilaceae bacterium]|nr:isopentenyl-diphosphate Delta-isomerase [Dermatophilaceae bacterium]